jgi:hypothetical protein
MNLDLIDQETAALLRELDALIDGDRYFMSAQSAEISLAHQYATFLDETTQFCGIM